MKTKHSPHKPRPLNQAELTRARQWHAKKLDAAFTKYHDCIFAAWLKMNEATELKRYITAHLHGLSSLIKGTNK